MDKRAYHHGDLRHAMLAAAEAVLAERGVEAFSLRECARRAGVSPAAPAHHFGNVAGLLTALAAIGFEGLADAVDAAARDAPGDELHAAGVAYVRYGCAHPSRFRAMFGRFPLHHDDPALCAARERAYGGLRREIARRLARENLGATAAPERADAAAMFVWSTMHGLTVLLLDGNARGAFADAATMAGALMRMAEAAIRQPPSP